MSLVSENSANFIDQDQLNDAESYWNQLTSPVFSTQASTATEEHAIAFALAWDELLKMQQLLFQERCGREASIDVLENLDPTRNPLEKQSTLDFIQNQKIQMSLAIPDQARVIEAAFDLAKRKLVFELEVSPVKGRSAKQHISHMLRELIRLSLTSQQLSLIIDWKNYSSAAISIADLPKLTSEALYYDSEKRPVARTAEIRCFKIQLSVRLRNTLIDTFKQFEDESEKFLTFVQGVRNSVADEPNTENVDPVVTDPIEKARLRLLKSIAASDN